jgi:hypothetical protein
LEFLVVFKLLEGLMELTRRQIALIVASIVSYEDSLDDECEMTKQELYEIIEILDEEYQTLI